MSSIESVFPIITAQDDSDWRIDRLHTVWTIMQAQGVAVEERVVLLHDHQGHLFVTWRTEPDSAEKKAVEIAWAALNESAIEHRKIVEVEP